jgi:hypothetical protein
MWTCMHMKAVYLLYREKKDKDIGKEDAVIGVRKKG